MRWLTSHHVVICGLGGNGYLLATRCYELGMPVVAIESDPANEHVPQCREQGIIVMEGNARDPVMLDRAGVKNARYLVAVSGNDSVNVEIMMGVRKLVEKRKGRHLTCVLHILDPHLCRMLAEREIRTPMQERFRVQFFSVYERGARVLLAEEPPFRLESRATDVPHLLVVGLGRLGQNLVLEAARQWWWSRYRQHPGEKLPITVIDREAEEKMTYLRARYALIDEACKVAAVNTDFYSRQFEEGAFLFGRSNHHGRDATHVYVCLANDTESLSVGLALAGHVRDCGIPAVRLVIRTIYEAGIAEFLHEDRGTLGLLKPFGLFDRVARPGLLLDGINERIARAFHDDFRRQEEARRRDDPSATWKPTDKPWEELTEEQREVNRQRADEFDEHLKQIGYDIRPRADWSTDYFTVSPDDVNQPADAEHERSCRAKEADGRSSGKRNHQQKIPPHAIEQLAQMEHQRWRRAKEADGWTYGERNEEQKTHPDLVPWEDLRGSSKEYNRESCRRIPIILAMVGFEVYKTERPPESRDK